MTLSPRREAFRVDIPAVGIDHQRTQPMRAFGDYVANSATTFTAGMLVDLNAAGEVIRSVGVAPYGWVKYNKTTGFFAAVIGEYIQLVGVAATNLAHANLRTAAGGIAGVRVYDAAATVFTEGGGSDYTVSYVNGTITRVAGGTIPAGGFVFVDYQYAMTASEIAVNGHNFWNFDDDVTVQAGKVVVITGPGSIIYTTMYDPHQTYDVNDLLTAGTTAEVLEGYVTIGGAGLAVGRVVQVPTPSDPFLGIKTLI